MSLKNHHQYIQPSPVNSRPSDHGARSVTSFLQNQEEPAGRQSVSSQDSLALRRVDGQQSNPRERHASQSDHGDHYRNEEGGSLRQYDTSSQVSPSQYTRNDQHMSRTSTAKSLEPSYSRSQSRSHSHLRHPSLSLDTHHVSGQPHHFSSRSSGDNSPGFSPSVNASLNADLQALRVGLESVWNLSSKQLHSLHASLATKAEQNQTLAVTHGQLQSSITEQHAALSREVDRLRAENVKLAAEKLNADETKRQAIYEREVLGIANERLWEDKVKLEGERRELKVKLDAETECLRLCQQELAKRDRQMSNPQTNQADERPIRVKMEIDEDSDQLDGPRIPLVQVEEVIYARLKQQADNFGREIRDVYENLAKAQTRATELEALLRRNSPNPNHALQHSNNPLGGHAIAPSIQPYPRHHPSTLSPVTPQTAILSSVSEVERSEFPLLRSWNGKQSGPQADHHLHVHRGDNQQRSANIPFYQRRVSGPVISTPGRSTSESSQRRYSAPTDTGSTSGGASANLSPAMDSMCLRTGAGQGPNVTPMEMSPTNQGAAPWHIMSSQPPRKTSRQQQASQPQPSSSSHEAVQKQSILPPCLGPPQYALHNRLLPDTSSPPPRQEQARDPRQYASHSQQNSQSNSSQRTASGRNTSANHPQQRLAESLPPLPHAQQPNPLQPPYLSPSCQVSSPDARSHPRHQYSSHYPPHTQQPLSHPAQQPPTQHTQSLQQSPQQPPLQHTPSSQDAHTRPSKHTLYPSQPAATQYPAPIYPPQTQQKGTHSRSSSTSHPEPPPKRARIINKDAEMQDAGSKSKKAEGAETVLPIATPGRMATPPTSSEKIPIPKVSPPCTVIPGPTSNLSAVPSVSAASAPTSKVASALPPCAASPSRPPPPSSITQDENSSKFGLPTFPSRDSRPALAPQMSMQRISNTPITPTPLSPTDGIIKASDELSPDEKIMFKSLSRVLGKKRDVDTGTWKCTVCKQEKMSQPVSFGEDTPVGVVTQHVKIIHRQFWKELKATNLAEASNSSSNPL